MTWINREERSCGLTMESMNYSRISCSWSTMDTILHPRRALGGVIHIRGRDI